MLRFIAMIVGILGLAGCTSAPVQETTSPDFYAAQAAIARAEKHLEAQEYTRARYAAMEAKRHAGAALAGMQHADGTGVVAPPGASAAGTPPH
jgi:hypothetical protein